MRCRAKAHLPLERLSETVKRLAEQIRSGTMRALKSKSVLLQKIIFPGQPISWRRRGSFNEGRIVRLRIPSRRRTPASSVASAAALPCKFARCREHDLSNNDR
jgi:hypothetical protein